MHKGRISVKATIVLLSFAGLTIAQCVTGTPETLLVVCDTIKWISGIALGATGAQRILEPMAKKGEK